MSLILRNANALDLYLIAISKKDASMPSEKVTKILRSKTNLSNEDISNMSDSAAWDLIYANASPIKEKLPKICFTGFTQAGKDELSIMAKKARFTISPSVTKSLSFLCVGDNPGDKKLEQAKGFKTVLLNITQLLWLLETGEIPTS